MALVVVSAAVKTVARSMEETFSSEFLSREAGQDCGAAGSSFMAGCAEPEGGGSPGRASEFSPASSGPPEPPENPVRFTYRLLTEAW